MSVPSVTGELRCTNDYQDPPDQLPRAYHRSKPSWCCKACEEGVWIPFSTLETLRNCWTATSRPHRMVCRTLLRHRGVPLWGICIWLCLGPQFLHSWPVLQLARIPSKIPGTLSPKVWLSRRGSACRRDELVIGLLTPASAQGLLDKYPPGHVEATMLKYVAEGRAAMGQPILKVNPSVALLHLPICFCRGWVMGCPQETCKMHAQG